MSTFTESEVEDLTLAWFAELGYDVLHRPNIAPDGESPERTDYQTVVLEGRLQRALKRLNPDIPHRVCPQGWVYRLPE